MKAAAASWTSSSASMDSFSSCGVLLDESYPTAKSSAPLRRNVRRQMHSFRSVEAVECLLMLLKSCMIVIK